MGDEEIGNEKEVLRARKAAKNEKRVKKGCEGEKKGFRHVLLKFGKVKTLFGTKRCSLSYFAQD